jgi:hypothetical protein
MIPGKTGGVKHEMPQAASGECAAIHRANRNPDGGRHAVKPRHPRDADEQIAATHTNR